MKNLLLFISITVLFLLSSANKIYPQWNKQSPSPTGRDLYSVTFVSPTHLFASGENHYLLESTDAGVNWSIRISDNYGTDPYYIVYFSDAAHGYITGNNDDALRTTNGGITWIPMTLMSGSWSSLDFVTPTQGFAGANGVLAFTPDGGASWQLKSVYPSCPIIFGMDFKDLNTGLVGGTLPQTNEVGIFKTTDGGSTWSQKTTSGANDVIWMNGTTAVATVGNSIYRSTDSGEIWSLISSVISTGLVDIAPAGTNTIVGVSGKGDIWRSSDGGFNWNFVLDGLGDLPAFWSVSFANAGVGSVVGQSGLIYTTQDGGVSWQLRSSGMGVQIYDLEMHTHNFGLVAGENGYVFRTTNGGRRWDTQKLEVTGQIFGRDEGLRAMSIVDDGFAATAGPGGTVFRTYNGGISWQSIGYPVLPDPFFIEDIKFINRNTGWIVGLDQDLGHFKSVYKTTNGGDSWTRPIDQNSYLFSVDFTDVQHGWISSIGPLYLTTTNGGVNWVQRILPPYFTTPTVSKMRFADNQNGWVVGWDGFVARSNNGGINWTIVDVGTTEDHFFGVSVISPSEVWVVGRESFSAAGVVYHTNNAGQNWTRELVTTSPDVPYTISAFSSGNVWTGGYAGTIFKKGGINFTLNLSINFEAYISQDTIKVELRSAVSPFNLIESQNGLGGQGISRQIQFFNISNGTPYYIVVKHRNSIETWSKSGGEVFTNNTLTYNFISSASQAFGSNMVLVNGKYSLYSGDINQDGTVDLTDLVMIFNDAASFVSGYTATDLNGDNFVDTADLLVAYNNSARFVGKVTP